LGFDGIEREPGRVSVREKGEKSLRAGHPWVYSGGVASVKGAPGAGDWVGVYGGGERFYGWGHYSPESRIAVRVLEWGGDAPPGEDWWRSRLSQAVERRREVPPPGPDSARRLVHGESDGLPGLVLDRYGSYLVLQAFTAGMDRRKEEIASIAAAEVGAAGVYERSDTEVRRLEGLGPSAGLLVGEEPPDRVTIAEGECSFLVDIRGGQKTGFYIDQRRNREVVARHASGRRVLDLFCYTGAFACASLTGGAEEVLLVDSSPAALALAEMNLVRNGHPRDRWRVEKGNAFEVARSLRDRGESFDLVVVDPPKLAPTRAHAPRAGRAYKDINLLAIKLCRPGGLVASFSCSAGVDAGRFQQILAWAAVDAAREVRILERFSQPPDHPVSLRFPEGEYLKGLLCRVD